MRASYRWLSEFVDLPEDPSEVKDALDHLGVEVEAVERVDLPFRGVVTASVTGIEAHPDADRIRVVTVDTGDGARTVVCGAWNFEEGAVVAYSPPGAVLAGGLEVGEREIRGVASPGMICSEMELGIGEDADGILVLPSGSPIGEDLGSLLPLPDTVFDVTITSNRPDLMSMYGLARDLAAYFETDLRHPSDPAPVGSGTPGFTVRVEDSERCPRCTARHVRGLTVADSPPWLKARLRAVGVRPISNVVDATNYVMLELGQPLHAFDLDRVADATIVVRTAQAGETLVTLDGEERTLHDEDLVIADASRAIGLAGVMGGEDSEVTEATRDVLLEAAHFSPASVLFTGKRHALRTEASARFERGVDIDLPPLASARAAAMIIDLAGGEVVGELTDVRAPGDDSPVISLPVGEVERLLGVAVPEDEITGHLTRLGFRVEPGDPLSVTVPSYRPDVTRAADLVEEVARLHGFDGIPARLPKGTGGGLPPEERARRRIREVLIGAGYLETISFDFVSAADVSAFGFGDDDPRSAPVRIHNPIHDEQDHLRTTLLPGLLTAARGNAARNRADVALFELGSVFLRGDAPIPDQPRMVGFLAMGNRGEVPWQEGAERDALDATGLVEVLFTAMGVPYRLDQGRVPGMHPERGAHIVVGRRVVGSVGELDPEVAARWDVDGRVACGEIDSGALMTVVPPVFRAPSQHPPIVVDLAFDVPDRSSAAALLDAVREGAGSRLERLVVFDVFSGPPLEEGRRSIAVRLTFRDPERTLTDDELGPVRDAIASQVASAVDGRVRGA